MDEQEIDRMLEQALDNFTDEYVARLLLGVEQCYEIARQVERADPETSKMARDLAHRLQVLADRMDRPTEP